MLRGDSEGWLPSASADVLWLMPGDRWAYANRGPATLGKVSVLMMGDVVTTKLISAPADKKEWPGFSKEQAAHIMVGDRLWLLPLYNRTERAEKQLAVPVKVTQIVYEGQHSQTGWMLWVEDQRGRREFLDAGWFYKLERRADEASTT